MWWKAEAADLHRVQDRVSTIYVERCHVDRDENAVVFVNRERTVRLPAALIGAVLIGPGTRVTHAAVSLLADSGSSVCWVGEHGVRMYACGLGPSRGAQVIQRQARLVSDAHERLRVAREMYSMRFPDDDVSGATMQQLRGREGARIKRLYRQNSDRTGVTWRSREYRPGDAFAAGDDVNRVLSAANAALYGACHAAVVGVGASAALGFVHVGSAISFVLDIADLYKAEYTIPLAFDLVASGRTEEADARFELRNRFAKGHFMPRVVRDVLRLIMGEEGTSAEADDHKLWDEVLGSVEGGVNWSLEEWRSRTEYFVISGPELDPNDAAF
ncbi:MAG: type I-E CRISPR-associated endonuclease Cas1 [Actinomycetales bacterium]|nr:type I-E CRISPR-associated endonuclease Cas1 [Actinomycetales bacterium]